MENKTVEAKAELKKVLKEKGLDLSEETLVFVMEKMFDFVEVLIKNTENKFDDMALTFIPMLKVELVKLIDKIDKEKDY